MKTIIIVQARMTSTRLPGKVLLPLAGEPMLVRLLERLRRVQRADGIVIATTTNASDDPIAALCAQQGVPCHRGSELDVLSRYADAARLHAADVVVRITSDCPLIDPALIDQLIAVYEEGDSDYVSNMLPPTWPYGMAVEVFSATALAQAHAEATQDAEREHVTPFIYWHPEQLLRHISKAEIEKNARPGESYEQVADRLKKLKDKPEPLDKSLERKMSLSEVKRKLR